MEVTYGHEQLHVQKANAFLNNVLMPGLNDKVEKAQKRDNWESGSKGIVKCRNTCKELTDFVAAMINAAKMETGHDEENTRTPLFRVSYPPIGKMPKNPKL